MNRFRAALNSALDSFSGLQRIFKSKATEVAPRYSPLRSAVANDSYEDVKAALQIPGVDVFEVPVAEEHRVFLGEPLTVVAIQGHQNNALRALLEDQRIRDTIDYQVTRPSLYFENQHRYASHDGSAAHIAAGRYGSLTALQLLKEAGANLNLQRHAAHNSFTPLDEAECQQRLHGTHEALVTFIKTNGGTNAPFESSARPDLRELAV